VQFGNSRYRLLLTHLDANGGIVVLRELGWLGEKYPFRSLLLSRFHNDLRQNRAGASGYCGEPLLFVPIMDTTRLNVHGAEKGVCLSDHPMTRDVGDSGAPPPSYTYPRLAWTLRCTLKVRQEIYPTDVMVKGEPLI
jgi:hypothetical protein